LVVETDLVLNPFKREVLCNFCFANASDLIFHEMVKIKFEEMKIVCRIAVEADVNEELSQLNWHFESGHLFDYFFPGAILF